MSHTYAHHAQQSALPPPAAQLLDYVPADDQVYKRRYFALKNLVHALEDENNMLALKLAQITTRCRDAEIARLRSLDESARNSGARGESSRGEGSRSSKAVRPTTPELGQPQDLASYARREEMESGGRAMDIDHLVPRNSDDDRLHSNGATVGQSPSHRAAGVDQGEDLEGGKKRKPKSRTRMSDPINPSEPPPLFPYAPRSQPSETPPIPQPSAFPAALPAADPESEDEAMDDY